MGFKQRLVNQHVLNQRLIRHKHPLTLSYSTDCGGMLWFCSWNCFSNPFRIIGFISILYVRKYEHQEWSRIEHTELEILSIQVLGSMHAFCHIPTWLVAWLSSKGVVVFYCLLQHSVLVILQHYHFHSPQLMIHT